jgi:hypothetical protein
MGQFVNNDVSSGSIVYASDHNTQGALIAAVLNGNVDDSNLASSAVTETKLASNSVATAKIADSAVTAPKIGGIRLSGRGAAVDSGTPPSASTTLFLAQAGSTIVTTNGSGDATISLPTAFPGGILTVVVCDGDDASNSGTFAGISSGTSKASFNVSSSKATTAIRVNWIAIGW